MKVLMCDCDYGESWAESEDDCKSDVDKEAYNLCIEQNDVVHVGCVSAVPVWMKFAQERLKEGFDIKYFD